jgi:hypothetical protein
LSGEVPYDIGKVTFVVGPEALFLINPFETVRYSRIGIKQGFLLDECLLKLKPDLDDFDRRCE